MKLKDWADKQGISYLTAWRWFKAGDSRLAGAYQSDSGTIIVPEDNTSEPLMNNIQDSDIMTVFLKKTVEFSKNEHAIEEFAAWILSNFTLKIKGLPDAPRYSRVRPKSEEIQKHFQQFIKPKGDKPKPNMFVAPPDALDDLIAKADDLTAQELVDEIHKIGAAAGTSINPTDAPEVGELMKDLSSALNTSNPPNLGVFHNSLAGHVTTYNETAEGVVQRSVDLTPQQINYTSSVNPAFGNNLSFSASAAPCAAGAVSSSYLVSNTVEGTSASPFLGVASFTPTQKELDASNKISTLAEKPKRGRKPSKNLGNK